MTKVRTELKPHSTNQDVLKKSSNIYSQGRTPEVDKSGRVTQLDVKPGGPDVAADHLVQIQQRYGRVAVQQAVNGLHVTRGNKFVLQMMGLNNSARQSIERTAQNENKSALPEPVHRVLTPSQSGMPLSSEKKKLFNTHLGKAPKDVRIVDNGQAHEAAESIGARAFTLGNRIFFGKGQYNPHTSSGNKLLAHEVTHTYQQEGAPIPTANRLRISSPHDPQESQADRIANSIASAVPDRAANVGDELEDRDVAAQKVGQLNMARIQRAISFTTADQVPTTNRMDKNENAAGFRFQANARPLFQWQPDVTIHGNPGDPFADWQTAHHQVAKGFWRNVYWGTGANRTRRRYRIDGGLPMRDATAAGNTWYHDAFAQGFAANGDTRSPIMNDSPGSARHPWDNPVAGRAGNRGWFNYGFGFVVTLSARHRPTGTGAAAFRHLSHRHWNFGIAGNFDATQAMGSRVNITTGGPVNFSPAFSGFDPDNPPMHGGAIVNNSFAHTDT